MNTAKTAETIGARIRRFRRAADVTQAQLAVACELDDSAISNIEAGRRKVTTDDVTAIAKALAVSPSELAGW
jgi:transcriptional regulator with XRE-family HTH domain